MHKRNIALCIATLVCLLVTAGIGRHVHHVCAEQVETWNEVARTAFRDALIMEVEKRGDIKITMATYSPENMQTLAASVPEFVTLEKEGCGKKRFRIPPEKYAHSIAKDGEKAALLEILLEKHPLSTDALNRNWDSLMLAQKVVAQTYIRYTYTDFEEHDSMTYSRLPDKTLQADSLLSYYMGYRMEHELTGFIAYGAPPVPVGWWCGVALMWCCLLALIVYRKRLSLWLRSRFVKREVIVQEKIVEKEVHLAEVDMPSAERYDLGDGVIFDVTAQELRKGKEMRKLLPQTTLFLKYFINAPEHCLTTEEIYQKMWNGNGTPEMLHSSVYRLRQKLNDLSQWNVIYENNGIYRLYIANDEEIWVCKCSEKV